MSWASLAPFRSFKALPNLRLKLSGCGGRLIGNGSLLVAVAAPPQLKRDPLGSARIQEVTSSLWPICCSALR